MHKWAIHDLGHSQVTPLRHPAAVSHIAPFADIHVGEGGGFRAFTGPDRRVDAWLSGAPSPRATLHPDPWAGYAGDSRLIAWSVPSGSGPLA